MTSRHTSSMLVSTFVPANPCLSTRLSRLSSARSTSSRRAGCSQKRLAVRASSASDSEQPLTSISEKSPRPTSAAGFKTVSESPMPVQLTVHGKLPSWLRGELTRVGPAVFEAQARDESKIEFESWFDGLPFLHRISIRTGDKGESIVTYFSKHVSKHIERAIAHASTSTAYRSLLLGTVVNPNRTMFEKVMTSMFFTN
jgi:hypothetical protein